MDKNLLLQKLNELNPTNGFDTQEQAIAWTTKVKPLLNSLPDKSYFQKFSYYANYFSLNLSSDLLTTAYNIMKSELRTAIAELTLKLEEEKKLEGKFFPQSSHLDLQIHIAKLIKIATAKLWVCDAYMDHIIIEELANVSALEIRLLTTNKNKTPLFQTRLGAAQKQLSSKTIEVKINSSIHDRFFILDESDVWSLGTSYNSAAGGKGTSLTEIIADKDKVIASFITLWDSAAPFTPL